MGLAWAQPPSPQACSPELQNLFPFFQGVAVFGNKAAGHLLAHGQGLRQGWETPTKGIPSPLETLDDQAQEILLQAASAPPKQGVAPRAPGSGRAGGDCQPQVGLGRAVLVNQSSGSWGQRVMK